jgi:cell wall-associated NlpC family hydrolase
MEQWRVNVIAEAREWKGTPYQHKGRIKRVGVDCGGLLHAVYSKIGVLPPFPQDYAADWALHAEGPEIYIDFIAPFVTEVKRAVPGGLAMFKVAHRWAHGAIVTEKNTFVHAWGRNQEGGVVEWTLDKFVYGLADGKRFRPVRYFDVRQEWLAAQG